MTHVQRCAPTVRAWPLNGCGRRLMTKRMPPPKGSAWTHLQPRFVVACSDSRIQCCDHLANLGHRAQGCLCRVGLASSGTQPLQMVDGYTSTTGPHICHQIGQNKFGHDMSTPQQITPSIPICHHESGCRISSHPQVGASIREVRRAFRHKLSADLQVKNGVPNVPTQV